MRQERGHGRLGERLQSAAHKGQGDQRRDVEAVNLEQEPGKQRGDRHPQVPHHRDVAAIESIGDQSSEGAGEQRGDELGAEGHRDEERRTGEPGRRPPDADALRPRAEQRHEVPRRHHGEDPVAHHDEGPEPAFNAPSSVTHPPDVIPKHRSVWWSRRDRGPGTSAERLSHLGGRDRRAAAGVHPGGKWAGHESVRIRPGLAWSVTGCFSRTGPPRTPPTPSVATPPDRGRWPSLRLRRSASGLADSETHRCPGVSYGEGRDRLEMVRKRMGPPP